MQGLVDTARAGADALALRGDPVMSALLFAWLWLSGAVWASFCGVLAFRLPRVMGWADGPPTGLSDPPSSCDGCGTRIPPLALVPVFGWLAARGRCGSCGGRVPARYPLAEAALGTLTAAAPLLTGGANAAALSLVALAWVGLALAWIDLESHVLPEFLTVPLLFAGLLATPFEGDPWMRSAGAALCAGAMWLTFRILGRVRRVDAMSGGDVALAAAGGAWLGPLTGGWFLLAACALFALHAGAAARHGARWVPMGPALAAALLAASCAAALDQRAFLAAQGLTS